MKKAIECMADDLEDAINALESGEAVASVIPALKDVLTGLRMLFPTIIEVIHEQLDLLEGTR